MLLWPRRIETLSRATPARSSSTAKVSRNRWGWPVGTFANSKNSVIDLPVVLSKGDSLWLCNRERLKQRKSQGSQATVEQALVDVNVLGGQLLKAGTKVSQISSDIRGFKQSNAAENL